MKSVEIVLVRKTVRFLTMSIIFEKVDETICKQVASIGRNEFIRVTIDPSSISEFNLPPNYKYHSVFLPQKYLKWFDRLKNYKIRESDIWICGIPKTGTTWIHNVAWQLKNNLNFNAPAKRSNDEYFEAVMLLEKIDGNKEFNALVDEIDRRFSQYENLPSPRILKSHFPAFLLPQNVWTVKSKIIYITRNPKDTMVSLYYMIRNNVNHYTGTLDEMCESYMNGTVTCTPFFEHLFSYWQLRHLDHVLFLTYEQLSADPFGAIKQINDFLECTYTDEQLKDLTEYVSFEKMRKKSLENTPADINGGKQDQDYR